MINFISDKYCDFLISKGKLNVKGSKEWSEFDYKLRCNIFNYGSLLVMLLLNIFTGSWKEFLIIMVIFNILRNFTDGIHAKRLSFCFYFSSCYFTLLSVMAHKIIYCNNIYLYYSLPFLAIIWSICNYKYIPKVNINNEDLNVEDNEELTIEEKKQAYRWIISILSIVIIGGIFLFHLKFLPITISIGLISVQGILSATGEKIFNLIQDAYLELINKYNRKI